MARKPTSLLRIAAQNPEMRGAVRAYLREASTPSRKVRLSRAEHELFKKQVLERNQKFPYQGKQVSYRELPEEERDRVRERFQKKLRHDAQQRVRHRMKQTGVLDQARTSNVISPDAFRMSVGGTYLHDPHEHHEIWKQSYRLLDEILRRKDIQGAVAMVGVPGAGKSTWLSQNQEPGWVYFDATLASPRDRKKFLSVAKRHPKPVEAVHLDTPLQISLAQNATRTPDRKVPEQFLQKSYANLLSNPPTEAEGFDRVVKVQRQPSTPKEAGLGQVIKDTFRRWVSKIEEQRGGFDNPNPQASEEHKRIRYDSLPKQERDRIKDFWESQQQSEEDTSNAQGEKPPIEDLSPDEKYDFGRLSDKEKSKWSAWFEEKQPLSPESASDRAASEEDHPDYQTALYGQVHQVKPISERTLNQTFKVTLKHKGHKADFVFKPTSSEKDAMRRGIDPGTYHAREAAAYQIAKSLGLTQVPKTITRGTDNGSYQLWRSGTKSLSSTRGKKEFASKVNIDNIDKSPDFEAVNFLDLVLGNTDRHEGNLLYAFEGEEKPENVRYLAIDNG